MAKITGPLMSLDASGSIAGTITFSKWKGRNYVRQTVTPSNPKSPAQTAFRSMFGFLSANWAGIDPTDQATWEALAQSTNVSAFNAYVHENQKRWTQVQTPGQAYPVAGGDTVGVITGKTATGGVRQISLAIPITTLNDNWGLIIYRSLTTGFTPSQNDVVGVILGNTAGTFTFIDSNLTPGHYYYRIGKFGIAGTFALDTGEINAIAT